MEKTLGKVGLLLVSTVIVVFIFSMVFHLTIIAGLVLFGILIIYFASGWIRGFLRWEVKKKKEILKEGKNE